MAETAGGSSQQLGLFGDDAAPEPVLMNRRAGQGRERREKATAGVPVREMTVHHSQAGSFLCT
jgi:hypothetical protein